MDIGDHQIDTGRPDSTNFNIRTHSRNYSRETFINHSRNQSLATNQPFLTDASNEPLNQITADSSFR